MQRATAERSAVRLNCYTGIPMTVAKTSISSTKSDDRLDLLLFDLHGRQRFGINVLKVQEIVACPKLIRMPDAHHAIRGVAHLRGRAVPVIDLATALGRGRMPDDAGPCWVIVTEFNRSHQGLLVGNVSRIVERPWQSVLPPPRGSGRNSYTSGVTEIEKELVQILDVERVLAEVSGMGEPELQDAQPLHLRAPGARVLVVDDSRVARSHTGRILEQLGIGHIMARDGREALDVLEQIGVHGEQNAEGIAMVISDIEMPEVDGYALTKEIRKRAQLGGVHILLHTSLNGRINLERAEHCGANSVLTKFVAEELADRVLDGLRCQAVIE